MKRIGVVSQDIQDIEVVGSKRGDGLSQRCRLDAIRLEAVFQTPTSHCTAHFETKERKLGGRHAQSKKVGL